MRLRNSHAALVVAASLVVSGLVGCAKDEDFAARPSAILTDREAARLAELHMDDTAADASPRDVVTIEQSQGGRGHVVSFHTFYDETARPPKQSRLVMVDHDGDVREVTFKD